MRGDNVKTIHSAEYAVMLRVLRQARKDAGITQGTVAARLRYRTSAISKMERGELRLDLVQLREFCAAIGLTLLEFVERYEAALAAPTSQSDVQGPSRSS